MGDHSGCGGNYEPRPLRAIDPETEEIDSIVPHVGEDRGTLRERAVAFFAGIAATHNEIVEFQKKEPMIPGGRLARTVLGNLWLP